MTENRDPNWKAGENTAERIEDLVKTGGSPIGLDVGTSKIAAARRAGKEVQTAMQLNAFLPVPYAPMTERTIQQQSDVSYFRDGDELMIYGSACERFANMFNADTARPMADGLLNPKEKNALPVLEAILHMLVPKARTQGEILAFSVPAAPEGREAQLTYHVATLRRLFEGMGYRSVAINEGLAVIFSELEDNNFTGIGISCGGGLCNGTLAYLSIPSIMFSIPKGGDYIDQAVGSVINEHATRAKVLKEEHLDLSRSPKDKLERALHIYYEDLVRTQKKAPRGLRDLPEKTGEAMGLITDAIEALQREDKEVLWGSMIKQTIMRKKPSFNESYYGYKTFSRMLEDAAKHGILELKKDAKSRSYIVEPVGEVAP